MNYKKSAAILSLVAVPVAVTAIGDAPVQAAESSKDQVMINYSWVNPQHIYDGTLKKPTYIRVASIGNIAANTIVNTATVEELKEAIYENIRQYNTSFSIAYKGNTDTLSQDLRNILEGIHTDVSMTYEAGTISRYQASPSGYVNDVTIDFTMDYHTTAEQEAFVNSEVERIAGELFTSTMSDFDKVKAVNDYIVLNTTYDKDTIASPHAAYAILKEGKGVCQAYALLAYRLLKEAGIDAYYVTGYVEEVGHAWNLVKVNGKWYHLDTTWNDPVFSSSSGDMSDFVQYKYFLVPDEIIKKDHIIDDNNYPVATDNAFAPLHTVETPVQVGSTLYFPSQDHDIQLYKLDLNNMAAGATQVSTTRVQHLVHIDGWLYFSDYSNGGYLSKMKLDGTEKTVVDSKSITSLKQDGNNLVYTDTNNATYTLQTIDPEAENRAATDKVVALINGINETAVNFVESVANARVAYDALTPTQKGLVTNYAVLEEAEGKIQANEATVSAVITKIAQLNEFASDFNEKVNEAKTAYNALDAELRAKVSNYSVLEAAITKAADNETKATDVEALINAINTNDATYYGATTTARNAFNALTAAQRTLLSTDAISKLEAAEQQKTKDEEAVFSVNYQLDLLNDTAANFKDIVPTIRAGYNALTANQKTLVLKLADLEAAETKYQEYQTAASQLITEIEALNSASPTFQQDVQTVNGKYNALNLAQQGFISAEAKAKLNEMVALSITNANSADVVIAQIQALSVTNDSFMADVQAARAAYNALTPTQQGLVTNVASLESAEAIATKITNVVDKIIAIPETTVVGLVDNFNSAKTAYDALSSAEQKHVTNSDKLENTNVLITVANTVTATIASLTEDSNIVDIEAARAAYEALTPLQKNLVTNLTDLQNAEARVKTEADQLKAQAVVNQITALGTIDANFVAKYTAAKVAYDALTEDQKALVTNATDITDLADEISAIQEVIDAIDAVSDVSTYKANATTASSKYKDLNSTLQVAVTNAAVLTAIEENIQAITAVETAISALATASSMTDIAGVKAQYEVLTPLQKQLVSNYASIESVENAVAANLVEQLITGLSESSLSFIADVTKARVAYDALTPIQQNLVPNYATLTAAEQRVAEIAQSETEVTNVIQLIAKVNDTAATFQTDLSSAEAAFHALTDEQKAQVTNANDLTTHNATLATYRTVATNIESQVTAIDIANSTFIDDVNAAQTSLSAFNEAQLSLITSTTKSLLQTYVDEIDAMRDVEAQLLALNALNTTFHADLAVAQAAYNALHPNYKVLLTAQALAKLGEAEQQVVADGKAAQEVIEEIALLSASSSATSVSTVRAKYNALTANQKQLVTNSAHLISIETALRNASSGTSSTGSTGSTSGTSSTGSTSTTGGTSSSGSTGSTGGTSSTGSTGSTSGTSSSGSTSTTGGTSSTGSTPSTSTPLKEDTQVNPTPNVPMQPEVKVEQHGNTYTAVVSIPAEADQAKPLTITISENINVKVPQMAIPTTDSGASIAVSFDVSEDNKIQFKASLNDEPVKFATYIELEIANLAEDAVILRVDKNGELIATPFIIKDGKHVVKTMTPGDFVISTETVTFGDVQKDGHKEYIEALAKRHIIKGVNEESFNPNAGISRAQFAVMIARAMNLEAEKETKFKDVKGQWYESAVQALAETGIINGKNPETFDPSQTLTRQQAALMVTRLLEFAGVELPAVDLETLPFNDVGKISESAKQQVAMVYALGIFTGKADGSFDPSGKLTRSQMTKVLYKTLQLAEML